jgi:NADH-quinone oxidoreductase subunit M
MRVETFPYLSVLTFLPMVGALIIFFIPRISQQAARSIALLASLGSLVVSILMAMRFDPQAPIDASSVVTIKEKL